jgi:hypothetical protein
MHIEYIEMIDDTRGVTMNVFDMENNKKKKRMLDTNHNNKLIIL